MEKSTYYMENNTMLIGIDDAHLPIVTDCDILTASESFIHMDRTAPFNVLILVTDGVMYVTENGYEHTIHEGELLFLKSGHRHYGSTETPRGTRWIYVHFTLPEEGYNSEDTVYLPKKLAGLSGSETEEKLIKLCAGHHGEEHLKKQRNNALFYDILLDLCTQQPKVQSISDKLCEFLDTQTDKPFSKELITGQFYLSYSYLAAEFKRETGMSMGQYHNAARMKRACDLLRSTLMSVGEISDRLGFSDMLYFSKKFSSFAGISPTDYRKQVQKKY